jgi:hypothetical protein
MDGRMRYLAVVSVALGLLAGVPACSKPAAKPAPALQAPAGQGQSYYCPMDKEVVADKPGTCPKCGMRLEVKK